MKQLSIIARAWGRASKRLEAFDREICPDGYRYDLCDDRDLARLDSLERECFELKMAFCVRAAALDYAGGPDDILKMNL